MISTLRAGAARFYNAGSITGAQPGKKKTNFLTGTFAGLTRAERKRFRLLIALDVFISIVDILSLALLLWIIRFYLQPGTFGPNSLLPTGVAEQGSFVLIAVFFIVFTIKNLAAFLVSRSHYGFVGRVAVRISKDNLERYQRSSFKEFIEVDSSVHLRKIAYQPFDFCQYMICGVQQIITQCSLILFTISGILWFNARLFLLLLLILLPPVVGVFYYLKKRLTRAKWHIKNGAEKSFQYLMDALKGYVEGNIYGRNKFFLKRFEEQRRNFSYHLFDSLSVQTLPSRLIEVFAVMGLFVLILIAKWSGAEDGESFITIGAFMAAAYKIIPGIVKIVNTTSQIKAYEFSLDELVDEHRETSTLTNHVEGIESIALEDIEFRYGGDSLIRKLSIDIKKGDFIGVTGRSGGGKTSLLNICLGFLEPSAGTIYVNGVACASEYIKTYWSRISLVRQQSFFIHDSIARNITLEEECSDEEKLVDILDIVGIGELTGHQNVVGEALITENGKNISGGQQQRVALARAIYKDADLVILDEPFNELDEKSELLLLCHFKKLAENGKIVVMVTHDRKALSFCNKIVNLDEQ